MDYSILLSGNHVCRVFGQPDGVRVKCAVCESAPDQDCIPDVRDMKHFDALIRAHRDESALGDAPERYHWLWHNSRSFRFDEPESRERFMRGERDIVRHASHSFQVVNDDNGDPDDPSFGYCQACRAFATDRKAALPCRFSPQD